MLTLLTDLPAGVVGVEAHGKVTASDYEQVLVPAVEAALQGGGKLRLLYAFGADFPDYSQRRPGGHEARPRPPAQLGADRDRRRRGLAVAFTARTRLGDAGRDQDVRVR